MRWYEWVFIITSLIVCAVILALVLRSYLPERHKP